MKLKCFESKKLDTNSRDKFLGLEKYMTPTEEFEVPSSRKLLI